MVSFICDACGNTVKKNQVEKHYKTQCRNCSVLACIDCGVDFPGDAYISHTSCITEAEKYQGHLYQPKDKENKGDAKQKQWTKQLKTAGANLTDPRLKRLFERLIEYSNIPRKKKKFENFCKNSVNVYDEKTLNALWDAFNATSEANKANGANSDKSKNTDKQSLQNNGTTTEDDTDTTSKQKRSKKKRKRENDDVESDEEVDNKKDKKKKKKKKLQDTSEETGVDQVTNGSNEEECELETENKGRFNWHKAIKTALKQADEQELPVKKLRKKVLSAYQEHGTDNRASTQEECRSMFNNKLHTYSKVKLKKDVVKLVK